MTEDGRLTFAERVLSRSSGQEALAGDTVSAQVDMALLHESLARVIGPFREMGGERVWDPGRVGVVLDHWSPSSGIGSARMHDAVRKFVQEQDITWFCDVGSGVCHQLAVEEGWAPRGGLMAGTDSHTPTAGAAGALAIGIGPTDMAAVFMTGELWLGVPESRLVMLDGHLPPGVEAKDAALALVSEIGAYGAEYQALEFWAGEGDAAAAEAGARLPHESRADRMTLCNMAVEAGAKAAAFPRLAVALGRNSRRGSLFPQAFSSTGNEPEVQPPDPSLFSAVHHIDLSALEPLAARPGRVDDVVPVADVAGEPVDQVLIGSCTGGRLADLKVAAGIIGDRKVNDNVRLIVTPASRRIWEAAVREGVAAALIRAGAVITAPGCGACFGSHGGLLADGEVCVSTTNRNFAGRMGSPEAQIYLASAATAAASAVAGRIADPREVPGAGVEGGRKTAGAGEVRETKASAAYVATSTSAVAKGGGKMRVDGRGGAGRDSGQGGAGRAAHEPPSPPAVSGTVHVYGDDVTTDHIFPGQYLDTTDPEEMAPHAMEGADPEFASRVRPGDIIVAGERFGSGSSRESAPLALKAVGVGAVAARSFGRIFYRNAINIGLPVLKVEEGEAGDLAGKDGTLDMAAGTLAADGIDGALKVRPPQGMAMRILERGGLVEYMKAGRQ